MNISATPSMNAQQFNYKRRCSRGLLRLAQSNPRFDDMAAWRWWQFTLTGERGELPELVSARAVPGTCFRSWA